MEGGRACAGLEERRLRRRCSADAGGVGEQRGGRLGVEENGINRMGWTPCGASRSKRRRSAVFAPDKQLRRFTPGCPKPGSVL